MADAGTLGAKDSRIASSEMVGSERIAQFYENENVLLDTLTGFVGGGITAGESVIVIATPEHLRALRQRMVHADIDLAHAMFEDRYIPLDANVALTGFMVGDSPDKRLFSEMLGNLLRRASVHNRPVRVFGEMTAMLWAKGLREAAVQLEQLWNGFYRSHSFSLLCAYPQTGVIGDISSSLGETGAAFSGVSRGF